MIGICFECEVDGEVDMHHVVPKSLGGTKTIPLCFKCHGLVHEKDFVKHRALLKLGVAKAKAEGKYKGRSKGSGKTPEEFLNTPKAIEIMKHLDSGLSYRAIARKCGYSSATVQKVNNLKKIVANSEPT